MAIPTIGTVVLTALGPDGRSVTLTTDPETYALAWEPRQAKIPSIGGTVTTQEWGKVARDAVVELTSGTQWLNVDVVRDLDFNAGLRGETFRLEDAEANDFVVRIAAWTPVKARGMPELYEYALTLEVLTMTLLRGAVYSGA